MKKLICLICAMGMLLTGAVSATPTNETFDDGYLPDGWVVQQPQEETDISGVKIYGDEKKIYIAKNDESEIKAGATRVFEKISGPGNINFVFSFSGEGKSVIELRDGANSEIPAIQFTVSADAFAYIDDTGAEIPIKSTLTADEKYSVKISGSFTKKTTEVSVDGEEAVTVAFAAASKAKNLTEFEAYVTEAGNVLELYHFSTDSTGSKYCWDEFQEEDDIAQWTFAAEGNDTAEIRSTGNGSYVSFYVAKSGQKWDNGSNINADIRATIASTSGSFKVTVKYAAVGDGYTTMRFCRNSGGYWHSNYAFAGSTFGYNPEGNTSQTPVVTDGLNHLDMHTMTFYADRTKFLYDLYLDGKLIGEDIGQVSAGADVYLGWIMMQRNNEKTGGFRLYSLEIEDEYTRGTSISEGVFSDEDGNPLTAISEGIIKGTYTVTNDAKGEAAASVVMMHYEGDMLKKITVTPGAMKTGETVEMTGEIEVDNAENSKVYMYLWNNINEIIPLTETAAVLE